VNNTVKHARAKNLKINMNVTNEVLNIVVSDDGKGYNKTAIPKANGGKGGFGLFALKEKVQSLNGNISILSERDKGTMVKIDVPLK
jgi:two-component system, NarL family, sensor histidine kinase DegS